MNKVHNILVTGVGAIIGYGIIESLQLANANCFIVGIDVFPDNYGKHICDKFIQVPYTNAPQYRKAVEDIIIANKIDLIFPGIEQDLYYFIENQNSFDTQIVLNQHELVLLSKDKLLMYNYLMGKSFKWLIPTFSNLNFENASTKLGLPFIVKPKSSYASKGFHVIQNEEKFNALKLEFNKNTIFQPYVGSIDEEYTISAFGDGNGNAIDLLILRRYLSAAGASEKAYTIEDSAPFIPAINELMKLFKPIGPTNFQFRKQQDSIYLLEINPRISSACSIRTKFGYNDPLLCIQHYLQNKKYQPINKLKGSAIRYIADKISYE